MAITPSYVGEPECTGVIERFMRALKEQCLYLHRFQNLAEARRIIGEFATSSETPSTPASRVIRELTRIVPVASIALGVDNGMIPLTRA